MKLRPSCLLVLSLFSGAPVLATGGAVAAGHPLATQAGITMLKKGGNAFDAAIAAAFALAVVEPAESGLGGGGFAVVYDSRSQQAKALDFREVAPQQANRKFYVDATGKPNTAKLQQGVLAGGVPGAVRGLVLLQMTYGKLGLAQVMAPAIRLAAKGFPVSPRLNQQLVQSQAAFSTQAPQWYPKGQPLAAGSRLVQADLAKTLQAIAKSGGNSFYQGSTARIWGQFMKKNKGLISLQDLKNYRPVWRQPLVGSYRDCTVVSMPPPSSGGVHLIEMLNILSLRDLKNLPATERTVFMAETMKRAYADRARFLGDPAFVPVPVAALTSLNYARQLEASLTQTPVPSAQVEPGALLDDTSKSHFQAWETTHESTETTHLSTMDSLGNAVALTQTLNGLFGAKVVIKGTGVLLNNQLDDFALAPNLPNQFGLVGSTANALAPGKRPLSSMTPTLVFKAGKPWLALGSPGGAFIITSVLQTLVNLIDLGQPLEAAINSPRFHHQWQPDELFVEPNLTPDLSQLYTLHPIPAMGSVQAVLSENSLFTAVADPRREGTAQVLNSRP